MDIDYVNDANYITPDSSMIAWLKPGLVHLVYNTLTNTQSLVTGQALDLLRVPQACRADLTLR